jgi:hypothetical protein
MNNTFLWKLMGKQTLRDRHSEDVNWNDGLRTECIGRLLGNDDESSGSVTEIFLIT